MTISATRQHLAKSYIQNAKPGSFMSGFFKTTSKDFHKTKKVAIDIERNSERIAVAVTDLSVGPRFSEATKFTTKELTPPKFSEAFPISAEDLFERSVGQNPFADVNFQMEAIARAFKEFGLREDMIRRSIELQASQALTTGTITLYNEDGVAVYTIDFKPKTAHFPTVSTAWNASGADPRADLRAVFNQIRTNGKVQTRTTLWGEGSWEAALAEDDFKKYFEPRRIDQGSIITMQVNERDGQYRGVVDMGNYKIDIWTYNGRYDHPQTGANTLYLPDDKVVCIGESVDLRTSFGYVPTLAKPDSRVLPFMPSRVSSRSSGIDMFFNAYLTQDNENLVGKVSSRPLCTPVSIDRIGCVTTGI